MSEWHNLPAEYQEVEWIEATSAGPYIKTGYIPSVNPEIEYYTKFRKTSETTSNMCVGGCQTNIQIKLPNLCDGNVEAAAYYKTNYLCRYTNNEDHEYMIKGNRTSVIYTFDGTDYTFTSNTNLVQREIYLFTFNNNGNIKWNFQGRIYHVYFKEYGEYICDFIPCYIKSTNEYGMYDLVSKQFFGNSGTGAFTGGPIVPSPFVDTTYVLHNTASVPRLPAEYQEIEYIETSKQQYIKTGYTLSTENSYKFEYKVEFSTTSEEQGIVGNYTTNTAGCVTTGCYSRKLFLYNAKNKDWNTHPIETNTIYNISYDFQSSGLCTLLCNNTEYTKTIEETTSRERELQLFSRGDNMTFFNGKCYYVKIYDLGELVREFIPCYIKTTNEYGMYDLVSKQFFGNLGTGAFTGGPIVPSPFVDTTYVLHNTASVPRLPAEYQEIEYIESTRGVATSGKPYIALVKGQVDDNYGLKMEFSMDKESDEYPAGFSTTANKRFLFWGARTSAWRYGWYTSSTSQTSPSASISVYPDGVNNFYTASLNFKNDRMAIFENISGEVPNPTTSFTNTDFYLFTSYDKFVSNIRIKWAQLSYEDEVVNDLVPCYIKSTHEYGMYDLITKQFFGSETTGEFTGGSEVVPVITKTYTLKTLKQTGGNT